MSIPNRIMAGRLERFFAILIDNMILMFPGLLLGRLFGTGEVTLLANFAMAIAYFSLFTGGPWQATPGQRILAIHVIFADGRPLSVQDGAMRYLAYIMPTLPLYASFLNDRTAMSVSLWLCLVWFAPILFRDDRTGIHDQLCRMRVVIGKVTL